LTIAADSGKHKIELSLQGVPVVSQFVDRPAEMAAIKQLLLEASPTALFTTSPTTRRRRRVVVVHGLGGIEKTQLAVKFVRKYHYSFSAVFWLDGSSEASLKQSFVALRS
jgi:predicted alpha/beta-fold hydrolase